METFREILSPDFLLRNSVYLSLLAGFICPILGVFLVLRRIVFLGVALPQISSTGIALALSMHVWLGHETEVHDATSQGLAFLGSLVFTLLAMAAFAIAERSGRGLPEGRLGTGYVVATAVSFLLLAKCPQAEQGWMHLLKGEIIAISDNELRLTWAAFGVVLICLLLFQRELLLVSFDRELAVTLKKQVVLWDFLLYLLIGITIAVGVLSVGPLIAFGFLLVPVLTAQRFAGNMRQLALLASAIGGLTALLGFWIAYRFDLPVGPTDVALLGAIYGTSCAGQKMFFGTRRLSTG